MNQPLNPYAVTTTGEHQLHPIHFGGLAARDDLMMCLRDSPPQKGLARLQFPATCLMLLGLLWLISNEFTNDFETLPSIVWILAAFLFLPGWFYVTRLLTPGRRKQIKRINVMAENQKPTRGWIDEELVVICDEYSVLRARWSVFETPLIFPTHLMLPLTTDANRRVVLPWRFFTSTEDVRVLCQALKGKHVAMVNLPPNERQLAELIDQHQSFIPVDARQSRQWTRDGWPFESSSAGQFDCTVDLAAVMTTRQFGVYSAIGIVFILFWNLLPVWVAAAGWFFHEYWAFGNWGFIHERLVSSLLVLIPTTAALLFTLYLITAAVFRSRHVQTKPFTIRLRSAGVHLSHESFESWLRWSSVKDVIAEEDCGGWVAKESGDEIRIPRICFDDQERFERFKSELQSFADNASSQAVPSP